MQSHEITIGGEKFSLKSDGDSEYVVNLVKDIQNRYDAVNNNKPPRSAQTAQAFRSMAIVAIGLLDELNQVQKSKNHLSSESMTFANEMSERIDQILAESFSL